MKELRTVRDGMAQGLSLKVGEAYRIVLPIPPGPDSYELFVLDEHAQGIPGISVEMTTPLDTRTVTTDANGSARVDGAPPGDGSARLLDLAELRTALAGREQSERRSLPLPEGDEWQVRTVWQADQTIPLTSGQPRNLMIVSRIDLYRSGQPSSWGELRLASEGPWTLVTEGDGVRLQMHADGRGARVTVLGQALPALDFEQPDLAPPPGEEGRWLPPDIYVIQAGDYLSKIAAEYLGDANRWREIWRMNQPAYAGRSPDLIYPGEQFHMPADAVPLWVYAQAMDPPPPADDPQPPEWASVDLDELLADLLAGDLDAVTTFLDGLPDEPPSEEPSPPPPVLEGLIYAAYLATDALQGNIDPSPPEEQEETWPSE